MITRMEIVKNIDAVPKLSNKEVKNLHNLKGGIKLSGKFQ